MNLKFYKIISNNKKKWEEFFILPRSESFLTGTLPSFYSAWVKRKKKPEINSWVEPYVSPIDVTKPVITWLGHATFLIQVDGITLITDPVFADIPLFKRQLPLGIPVDLLPPIDIVLLSHNHPDHMDMHSLYTIQNRNKNVHVCVAHKDKQWFNSFVFPQVNEFEWADSFVAEKKSISFVECTFLPAVHWSRRSIFDRNKSLWGSWLIKTDHGAIYFAGDTAYATHFSAIASEYQVNTALLPIGPAEPHEWMRHSHMGPACAGKAFLDLNANFFVPMHWGTFAFGHDSFDDPIIRLKNWWNTNTDLLQNKVLQCAKVGQKIIF